jgi:UDP-glucose:(heptosyl)LPS alpha-1,3-glucosyltransferase
VKPKAPEKPRIAVVVRRYGGVGGGEKIVRRLTETLAARGDCDLHVLAAKIEDTAAGITFHTIPLFPCPRFLSPLLFAVSAGRILSKHHFDIVQAHERIFEADIYRMGGTPHRFWAAQVRGKKRPSLFDRATAYVEDRLLSAPRCRVLFPVSTLVRDLYADARDLSGKTVHILPPGVSPGRFQPTEPDERRTVRKRFGFTETDTVILFVGMNFEVKGLDRLIAGLAAAKNTPAGKTLRLLVAGKGNPAPYLRMAGRLGVEPDIAFAGIIREGIEGFYAASDLFAMCSRFDTFGLVVLEAMASGLPVIVSNTVGARDVVLEGENGYVVDGADTRTLADRLVALADPDRRRKMAASGRKTAANYTWKAMADRVAAAYRRLFDEKHGRLP